VNHALRLGLALLGSISAALPPLYATPPIITGDVPVADTGAFELYTGFRYQEMGTIQRQVPHAEFVYGIADRWEVSVEGNYLSRAGRGGLDDLTLAAKTVVASETPTRPMLGASYELKFANGDVTRGLGSGGREQELRLRAQKSFGAFTPMLNAGRMFVSDVGIGGARSPRQDAWRASFAQEWRLTQPTKLLAEIYWRTSDEPGETHRLGSNAGFKHRFDRTLSAHAAVGGSLRDANRGGPVRRIYAGLKWESAAPRRP
jgi:hypothetical protein